MAAKWKSGMVERVYYDEDAIKHVPKVTHHFVAHRAKVLNRIVDILVEIRLELGSRKTSDAMQVSWLESVVRLEYELIDLKPSYRIFKLIQWYQDNSHNHRKNREDIYLPVIQSGPSLYDKFERTEKIMLARMPKTADHDLDATIKKYFFESNGATSSAMAHLHSQIFLPVKNLNLSGISDEVDLIERVGELYSDIRQHRAKARVTGEMLGGALQLMHQYFEWVSEQGWLGSVKLLQFDSPSFSRFRRIAAERDSLGRDPITGRN